MPRQLVWRGETAVDLPTPTVPNLGGCVPPCLCSLLPASDGLTQKQCSRRWGFHRPESPHPQPHDDRVRRQTLIPDNSSPIFPRDPASRNQPLRCRSENPEPACFL